MPRAREFFAGLRTNPDYIAAHEQLAQRLVLAKNVLRQRADAGLSQADLAAKAEMKQPRIAEIEGAKGNPTLDTLERIARALNTTPDRLLRAPAGADGHGESCGAMLRIRNAYSATSTEGDEYALVDRIQSTGSRQVQVTHE